MTEEEILELKKENESLKKQVKELGERLQLTEFLYIPRRSAGMEEILKKYPRLQHDPNGSLARNRFSKFNSFGK